MDLLINLLDTKIELVGTTSRKPAFINIEFISK